MSEQPKKILADLKEFRQNNEEALYRTLRALAEEDTEQRLYVVIRSVEEIKATYRAAVYGEISLLFGDVFTSKDAEKAKSDANLAFRELLEESHEFNGFLPKGILIDTPLALLAKLPSEGFDFFCYDAERLSILLVGEKARAARHRTALNALIQQHATHSRSIQTMGSKLRIGQGIWRI